MKTKTFVLFALSVLGGILVLGPIGGSQALAQTTYTTSTVNPTAASTTEITPLSATTTPSQAPNPNIPLCEIARDLTVGSMGEDVRCLQRYLNFSGLFVANIGPGSPGSESTYFGPMTRQALIRWQNLYANTTLTPAGLTAGTGYWGRLSFAQYLTLVRAALGIR